VDLILCLLRQTQRAMQFDGRGNIVQYAMAVSNYMVALAPINPKRLSTLRMYLFVCSASVRVRI